MVFVIAAAVMDADADDDDDGGIEVGERDLAVVRRTFPSS